MIIRLWVLGMTKAHDKSVEFLRKPLTHIVLPDLEMDTDLLSCWEGKTDQLGQKQQLTPAKEPDSVESGLNSKKQRWQYGQEPCALVSTLTLPNMMLCSTFSLQIKKIQDKVNKCHAEVEKSKDKYEKCLEDITAHNPRYMEDMSMQVGTSG